MTVDTLARRLTALFAYATAMAFVEAAVVVYLRALYPGATWSASPTVPFSPLIYRTEVVREAATIIMLAAVAYLAFKRPVLKLVTFAWIFCIWDLFYYVFLKVTLGWPVTLTDPDVFFLIPVPWVGPVWIPLLSAAVVIAVSTWLFFRLTRVGGSPPTGGEAT